jgi:predicted permease
MTSFGQDVRYAIRMLAKSPAFTTVAVLTLALGIGANTAIFSLVDAVMLKRLPVEDPQRLVLLAWDSNKWPPHWGQDGWDSRFSFSYPAFEQFREQNGSLSSLFAWAPLGFTPQNTTVSLHGEATLANGIMVTGNYFSGLGVTPLLGRGINDADEAGGAPRVAVISYAYWTQQFARDPSAIGKSIALNGIPFTIVGVAPPEFYGLQQGMAPEIWIAFADQENLRPWGQTPFHSSSVFTAKDWICLNIMGRLKPSVSRARAEGELDTLFRNRVTADWKPDRPDQVPHLQLLDASQGVAELREGFAKPLSVLMGAVGLVLLIACANLATLLLARASGRGKEISVRLAMGASATRIVRQLLTESVLLSLMGGLVGLVLARWATEGLLTMISSSEGPIVLDVRPDPAVLLFTGLASALTGILFGLAPAFRAARVDLASAMKELAANITEGRQGHLLGKSLVVAQVSASLVLMIGAGLFVRTLQNMERKNLGFNQKNLLLFGLDPTRKGYRGEQLVNLFTQLHREIKALPGVRAATLYEFAPFSGWSSNISATIEGSSRKIQNPLARFGTVGPDFFATMQIPLVLGRDILESDTMNSPKVAVVDETFVHHFFGEENPIGRTFRIRSSGKDPLRFEIVGVAKDVELTDPHDQPRPKAFFPYCQAPARLNTMFFEVRAMGDPTQLVSEVREVVRRADPDLPLMNVKTQAEQTGEALAQEKLFARLSSFFGLVALLLASIGLYGTLSYAVTRKTREIGIRMALGAKPADVLGMVIGQGLRLAALGVALGLGAGLGFTRWIASMIYGVSPRDPVTFALGSALLLLVASLACLIPARRAMRVDPLIALRYE